MQTGTSRWYSSAALCWCLSKSTARFRWLKGVNWARWVYLLDAGDRRQLSVGRLAGLWLSELFSIAGGSKREIFHALVMQKLPDMLVLLLLFAPASSRWFFRLQ